MVEWPEAWPDNYCDTKVDEADNQDKPMEHPLHDAVYLPPGQSRRFCNVRWISGSME